MSFTSRLTFATRVLNSLPRRSRRGFTLIELLVVVVIIGILASVALPSFVGAQDKARNASVSANVNTVRMGLEQYATDNNGSYPSSGGMLAGLTSGALGYLPGNRLPKAPWSTGAQTDEPTCSGGLAGASTVAGGSVGLTSVGSLIGSKDAGKVKNDKPTNDAQDYGCISYDYAPNDQIYVIYGSGKKNKSAVVAGGTSNGAN